MTEFAELDRYVNWLKTHGRKELTYLNYERILNSMLKDLKEDGRPYLMAEIREEDIFWLDAKLSETVCEGVRKQYMRRLGVLSVFITNYDVVKHAGLMYNDTMSGVNVHYITKEQLQVLYEAADPTTRMILVLGAYLGLRRAEMSKIKNADINGNTVVIHGKGHGPDGKIRRLRMPLTVMAEIERYRRFKDEEPWGHDNEYLLEGANGRGRRHGLTPTSVGRKLNELKRLTGIEFSTHSLRRLYATTLYYDTKADLITIKNLMGHEKTETTISRYIAPLKKLEDEAQDRLTDVLDGALGII